MNVLKGKNALRERILNQSITTKSLGFHSKTKQEALNPILAKYKDLNKPKLKGLKKVRVVSQGEKDKQALSEARTNLVKNVFVGNSKDFISGIQRMPEFDLDYVNLFRETQPFPLRSDIQKAKVSIHANSEPQRNREKLKLK